MDYGISDTVARNFCLDLIADFDKVPASTIKGFLSICNATQEELVRIVFSDTAFTYVGSETSYVYATLNSVDDGVVHTTGTAVYANFVANYDPAVAYYALNGQYLRFEVGTEETSPIKFTSLLLTEGEKIQMNDLELRISFDYTI